MGERLEKLISELGITQSSFAGALEVNKASISSYILKGAKPTSSFFIKILEIYPSVDVEWLLTGKGSMFKSSDQKPTMENVSTSLFNRDETTNQKPVNLNTPPPVVRNVSLAAQNEKKESPKESLEESRKVSSVIILYNDNTFEQI